MTTPVVLTGQLNELVLVSNSAKNVSAATINDILQKTPGGNTLGIDPGDTSTFHSYDVRTGICLVTNPSCTVENVFEALKRYPAPGATGESIYDGAITDVAIGPFGAGPVVQDIPGEFLQRHFAGCTIENARKLLVKSGFAAEELGPEFDGSEPAQVISRELMAAKSLRPVGQLGSFNCRIILQTDNSRRLSARGFFYFDGP